MLQHGNDHFPSTTEKWFWLASACHIGSAVALGGTELCRKLDALAERILGKVDGRREEMVAKCHTRHFGFCPRPKVDGCEGVCRH